MTNAQEVIERFTRSGSAREATRKLERWRRGPRRHRVVPPVMAHETAVVDDLQPGDVLAVCQRIAADKREHALGDIRRTVVSDVPFIRDWFPDFAYTHVLHFVAEAAGRLLTFNEYARHPVFKDAMYGDIRQAVQDAMARNGVSETLAKQAVRWRIGNAYYAFLKEQFVFAGMREEGFEVKQHPLADALFRVDCWVGETNIDLYVTNPRFRSDRQGAGRKVKSSELLADAVPPFKNIVMECDVRHTYGDVHLPDEDSVKRACQKLLESGVTRPDPAAGR